MATGFYRVIKTKQHGRYYYKYSIRNKLVKKELMAKDIKKLKDKVESHGFLWGIIDKEEYHDIMICSITSAIKSNNNLS